MRVVIVGGGFAGVKTALVLANRPGVDVKLISAQSYFEYYAALYRSATGRSSLEVTIPLRDFFEYAKNVEVLQDYIVDLNSREKYLLGETGSRYEYDELVLAMGNITEYFGIKGLKQYSFGIKSIHEALRLKRHLHQQLLSAHSDQNYVVVGAGATGVELSAELASYLKKIHRKHKVEPKYKIDLIEAGPRVLAIMPKSFSKIAQKRLRKLGINVMLNTAVRSETIHQIQLPSGSIESRTVIWTAGVANNPFFKKFPKVFQLGRAGRVIVNDYLGATPNIYVIGDCASTEYSGMAQTAIHNADFVAKNILRTLRGKPKKSYKPKKPIYAVPVGSRWAVVLLGNKYVVGRLGWLLRRLADLHLYLMFLPISKALMVWRYGFVDEEICSVCKV